LLRISINSDGLRTGIDPTLKPPLFERFSDPRSTDFARRHRDVIARFGRVPHRNALLGRVSSAEELAFLQTPGSRF
jgi:uncharacterized protein (DUF924 family)